MARPRPLRSRLSAACLALSLIAPAAARSDSVSETSVLVSRWLDALGGRDAVARVRCTWLWARFRSPRSGGRSEEWNAWDGRFRSVADFNQFQRITGYDGARGFVQDENRKVRSVDGAGLAGLRTEAYLAASAMFFPDRVPGLTESAGATTLDGRRCVALDARAARGRTVRIYLDGETYLPLRVRRVQDADTVWSEFSEYRVIDGVKEAFHVRSWTRPAGDTTEFTVEALRHLAAAPDSAFFTPPPDTVHDFAFDANADSAAVPLELWDGHVILMARSHGSPPLPFLLDTGAEASNLDAAWARRWGLAHELPLELKGTGGAQWGGLVRLDTLAFPGVRMLGQRIAAVDLSGVRPAGRAIAGVLGYDFLSRFVVRLDFARRVCTLHEPGSTPPAQGTALPLQLDGFVPRLEARLDDSLTGTFQLDTGAYPAVVLFRGFWKAHGLLADPDAGPEVFTSGVGGSSRNREAELGSLEIGPFRMPRPRTLFHLEEVGATRSVEDAGLIGMDFWRRFDVTLDYANRQVILNENRAAPGSGGPASRNLGTERVGR